jgi:hypothetical protein
VSECDTSVRTGTTGLFAVRTQYVHNPGQSNTHPPGILEFFYVSFTYLIFDSHPLLYGSLRLHLFPCSFYYSPPLLLVYKLTITITTSSFTSCDATIYKLAIFYSKLQSSRVHPMIPTTPIATNCDTTVSTVHPYALYVLYCLTLIYCTYYTYCTLYALYMFPCLSVCSHLLTTCSHFTFCDHLA